MSSLTSARQVGGCGASASPENHLLNDLGFDKGDLAKLMARCAAEWPDADLAGLANGCCVADVYSRVAKSSRMPSWLRNDDEKAKAVAAVKSLSDSTSYTGCALLSDAQFLKIVSQWVKAERPRAAVAASRIERTTLVSDVTGDRLDAFREHVANMWDDAVITPAMVNGTIAQMMHKLSTTSLAFMRWDISNAPRGG